MPQTLVPINELGALALLNSWQGQAGAALGALHLYCDGSQAVDTVYLTGFGLFDNTNNFSFGLTVAGEVPGNFTGWKIRLRYRYTGIANDSNLTVKVQGPLGTFSHIINSFGAPGPVVFVTGDIDLTPAEAAIVGAGVNYSLGFEATIGTGDPAPLWDITRVEFIIPLANEGYIGAGGIETGGSSFHQNIQWTGIGGIESGGNLLANDLVISANASGIYTLIPGQKYDVIYVRNTVNNQTENVRIPNPYIRSGYFGG